MRACISCSLNKIITFGYIVVYIENVLVFIIFLYLYEGGRIFSLALGQQNARTGPVCNLCLPARLVSCELLVVAYTASRSLSLSVKGGFVS
jgi:hypothetical protein